MSVLKCQPSARTVEFESRRMVIPDKYPYCISMEWCILKIPSGYQMSLHTEPKKHWQLNQQWAKGCETSLQNLSIRYGTRCILTLNFFKSIWKCNQKFFCKLKLWFWNQTSSFTTLCCVATLSTSSQNNSVWTKLSSQNNNNKRLWLFWRKI